ncbi:MAG: Curli production assembly/transport component CsgG [Verrucomicrobia bacterium ADurb.Bin474]|nr:MAG: Curli production assembly/transport component CsgG [Verrucomicrobia bacterium ADurb.Bin474]
MWKSSIDLQENMTGMLENVLMSTGRFVVVERENMGSTLNEQDLQSGGRAAQAGGVAQTGLIRSAKYLARAQILGRCRVEHQGCSPWTGWQQGSDGDPDQDL